MICKYPFNHVRITSTGDLFVCEKSKLDLSIGNILKDDFQTIWGGSIRKHIQSTILDKSYRLCNSNCGMLMNRKELEGVVFFASVPDKFPRSIKFDVDPSCNLACTYCRIKLTTDGGSVPVQILTKVFDYLYNNMPKDNHLRLIFDYRGEFLASKAWITLFESHPFFLCINDYPNVSFQLISNGILFDAEAQVKYKWLFDKTTDISISIDAGAKEDYHYIRKHSNWNTLWENLRQLDKNFPNIKFVWTAVLQKDNVKNINNLFDIAKTFDNLPEIHIAKLFRTALTEDVFNEQFVDNTSELIKKDYPKLKDYNDWIYD